MPRPLQAAIWLTCATNIVGAAILFWAFLMSNNTSQIQPFTDEDRTELAQNHPGGTYINKGTYRVCINNVIWFYHADGMQSSYSSPCWK